MTPVLTALGNRWDSVVATRLEASRDVQLTRRCADLADLLATAAAGLGSVAVVSEDLRGLDLSVVATLHAAGVRVVGLSLPGDEGSERRLRQLGVDLVVAADADRQALEQALVSVVTAAGGAGGSAGGSAGRAGGGPGGGSLGESRGREGRPSESRGGAGSTPAGRDGGRDGGRDAGRDAGRSHGGDDGRAFDPGEVDLVPGRVVAVWGPTGAPGRSTIAVNLAAELAGLGIPTLLIDLDTYGGCVAQALSMLDEAPGIAAATRAADQGTLDLPALARISPEVLPGMRVLTGIPRADRWPEVRTAALERVLTLARLLAQVVVLDCGFNLEDDEELSYDTAAPRRNAATLTALAESDVVLAVGSCDPVGLQRLVRGLQELGTVPSPTPLVVVNRLRAGAVGSRPEARVSEALERFAGITEVTFVPEDRAGLDVAALEGRVLAECAPSSPARAAIRALAASVAGVPVVATRRRRA
ncbi:MAG: hypothetical protein ABI083_08490 [Lapillicoccus sp.]